MNNEELIHILDEKIRLEKQMCQNARSFAEYYFQHRSYSIRRAVEEAYLKIVRDKILF